MSPSAPSRHSSNSVPLNSRNLCNGVILDHPPRAGHCAKLAVMRPFRRRLAMVIGVWLFCQTSALMIGPVSMCAGMATAVPGQQCTCAHDGGQEACPMHHPAKAKSKSCSCRSTTDTSTLAIASLLGPIAVLPSAISVVDLSLTTDSVPVTVAAPIDGPEPPDAPPPRA